MIPVFLPYLTRAFPLLHTKPFLSVCLPTLFILVRHQHLLHGDGAVPGVDSVAQATLLHLPILTDPLLPHGDIATAWLCVLSTPQGCGAKYEKGE